ncbi:hypothetical protein NPIL_564111 [Nephila pilipes]|uniref:Uncharacterized protein n=1 Tax=Nephila pilipes TaxID=299642 RepID=A0A8X6PQA8_NEPPI|nr:hypothetical protein NPIL_564111 [Nephila pilipes]
MNGDRKKMSNATNIPSFEGDPPEHSGGRDTVREWGVVGWAESEQWTVVLVSGSRSGSAVLRALARGFPEVQAKEGHGRK